MIVVKWRISPLWWPILAITAPLWGPFLLIRYQGFKKDRTKAHEQNHLRIDTARVLDIPTVEEIELTVLSEWRARDGFRSEPGVSYHFRTNLGSVLYDLAFGDRSGVVAHNAHRIGITAEDIDAVVISHLHDDHTGGARAFRSMELGYPAALRRSEPVPCFLPAEFRADGFEVEVVSQPRLLMEGIASTGPLARRLGGGTGSRDAPAGKRSRCLLGLWTSNSAYHSRDGHEDDAGSNLCDRRRTPPATDARSRAGARDRSSDNPGNGQTSVEADNP